MHYSNSRLHVINPIPAITLKYLLYSTIMVIETNEELDRDLTHPWESVGSEGCNEQSR